MSSSDVIDRSVRKKPTIARFDTWLKKTKREKGTGLTSVIPGLSECQKKDIRDYIDFESGIDNKVRSRQENENHSVVIYVCAKDTKDKRFGVPIKIVQSKVLKFQDAMRKKGAAIDSPLIMMYSIWAAVLFQKGKSQQYVGDAVNMLIYPEDPTLLRNTTKTTITTTTTATEPQVRTEPEPQVRTSRKRKRER